MRISDWSSDVCSSDLLGIYIGILLGGLMVGESIDTVNLLAACGMIWLINVVFGTLTFALGAITSKNALSGSLVGFFAFIAYMVTTLATTTEIVEKLNKLDRKSTRLNSSH